LDRFLEQQTKRIGLLQTMLDDFDDGKSKSFYCVAAALLPATALEDSLHRVQRQIKEDKVKSADVKTKASILRGLLDDCAAKTGVDLKLRQKPK
jgi:hypothetical protein